MRREDKERITRRVMSSGERMMVLCHTLDKNTYYAKPVFTGW